ncbi:unnamed protein product, partial [Closterium sp. NIES-53]
YTFGSLGVPGEWYGALEWVFPEWARKHELDKGEAVNILKGAIVTADRIVTVSPAVNILKGGIVTADRIVTVSPVRTGGRVGSHTLPFPLLTYPPSSPLPSSPHLPSGLRLGDHDSGGRVGA